VTKLLTAKELLEVVRTAQVDAQASGGGAKWPPRMALGGRSGPRRRAQERARERDAQNVPPVATVAPFRVQRGGTIPHMEAVRVPPAAPLPSPPAPAPPVQAPAAPFGLTSSLAAAPEPQAAMPAVGFTHELPPASAILAAMRAKGGPGSLSTPREPAPPLPLPREPAPLPLPREPEPLEVKTERLAIPATLAEDVHRAQPVDGPRARTQADPRVREDLDPAPEEPSPASPSRSLAALFPPPRAASSAVPSPIARGSAPPARPAAPVLTQPEPLPPVRSPALTIPEPAARHHSAPPIAREERSDERASQPTVSLDLPDFDIEVTEAPRRPAAIPRATADLRAREEDIVKGPPRRERTARVDRQRLEADRRVAEAAGRAAAAHDPRAEPSEPTPPATGEGKDAKRERTGGSSALSAFAKLASSPRADDAAIARAEGLAGTGAAAAALGATTARAAPAAPSIDISWLGNKPAWAPESASIDDLTEVDGHAPVALSQDETVVLLNYDAQASLVAISQKTGFSVYKVERIVERLMAQGVFEELPSSPVEAPERKFHQPTRDVPPPPPPSAMWALAAAAAEPAPDSLEGPATIAEPPRSLDAGPDIEVSESDDDVDDDDDLPPASGVSDDEDEPTDAELEANLRKLYETKLSRLDADARVAIATNAGVGAPELFALAFDKDPAVSKVLFENIHFIQEHARFASFHHMTSSGIDRLSMRNELMKDPMVQRRLLRNAHTAELVVRRILGPKRLIDVYKITNDRDVPDRQRMVARGALRQKFQTADPEDRLQLIWNTEGRCLTLLSGCPIDSKTTALFCARPVVSLMMVQNFSKFGATPPGIIAHFLKQNLVRRQVGIRNMLLKHPNCPSEAKRGY